MSVLSAFGLPVDAVEPVVLTFELNGVAALLPHSRLMGVLPNKDWFSRFSFWSEVTGILARRVRAAGGDLSAALESGNEVGPQMTLPAHELGHTFGLSTDSRLKDKLGVRHRLAGRGPCRLAASSAASTNTTIAIPNLQDGNPASGYWVRRGSEPPALTALADQEQCDSHCFMGDRRSTRRTTGRRADAGSIPRTTTG